MFRRILASLIRFICRSACPSVHTERTVRTVPPRLRQVFFERMKFKVKNFSYRLCRSNPLCSSASASLAIIASKAPASNAMAGATTAAITNRAPTGIPEDIMLHHCSFVMEPYIHVVKLHIRVIRQDHFLPIVMHACYYAIIPPCARTHR